MILNILVSGFELLEGPVWHPARGLIFADADRGGAYCMDANGGITTVFEHRRGIGGMVRHESDGLVVSGRNIAYKGPAAAGTAVLFEKDPANGIVGFNDITTDSLGRIYAGALGFLPTETELSGIDGSVRQVWPNIELTNGMGFSPDGKLLYHADSGDRTVYVYDVGADGGLSRRRPFARTAEGLPDGLAVAVDGSIWVAVAHAGKVRVFEPDGALRMQIAFPIAMITSLCFGGAEMTDVYVMSGSDGSGRPDAGTIFHLQSDIPGLPVAPARVRLPVAT
jgi:xylono-1,5-lactonase